MDITLTQLRLNTEKALSLQCDFNGFYDQILNNDFIFCFL